MKIASMLCSAQVAPESNSLVRYRLDLQRLSDVIRFHAFHGSKDLSITALQ